VKNQCDLTCSISPKIVYGITNHNRTLKIELLSELNSSMCINMIH